MKYSIAKGFAYVIKLFIYDVSDLIFGPIVIKLLSP